MGKGRTFFRCDPLDLLLVVFFRVRVLVFVFVFVVGVVVLVFVFVVGILVLFDGELVFVVIGGPGKAP